MHRKSIIVGLAAAAIVLSAGSAFAYWTVTGAGSSTATVDMIKPLGISASNVVGLAVGRPADITATLTNPNDFEVSLAGTHITTTVTADAAHSTCISKNFSTTPPATSADVIGAGKTITLTGGQITMLNTKWDQVSCQGATITLSYVLK